MIRNKNNQAQKGFTLIELLFSISILVVAGGVAAISLYNAYRNSLIDSTANRIQALLRTAQENSLTQKNGYAWGVYFDNTKTPATYALFYGATSSIDSKYSLTSPIKFTSPATNTTTTVLFNKLTGAPLSNATITISNLSTSQNILVNSAGQISN